MRQTSVIRCEKPKPIANGYQLCHLSTDFVLGSQCRYGCYEGYKMTSGASVVTCGGNGTLSDSAPTCARKNVSKYKIMAIRPILGNKLQTYLSFSLDAFWCIHTQFVNSKSQVRTIDSSTTFSHDHL